MPSPYDILINLQAKAQEVQAAAAVVTNLVQQVQAMGPALAANIQKGDAAAQNLTRDLKEVSNAVDQTGKRGAAAGAAMASGIEKATESTRRFATASNQTRDAAGRFIKVGEAAENAGKHVGGFRELFEQAFAFGIGNQIIEKVLEIPARLIEGFHEAIRAGVEFNREMETLGVGIAASLRQASPEQYLDFKQAEAGSAVALDRLRERANALGLDMKSLAETYQINLRTMVEAGVRETEQQLNLVLMLSQAAASKGLSGFQAQRDIVDLLNGRGNRTLFAKELGITDEDIKQATDAGKLYEFLTEKLSAYGEAGAAAASTFAAASQRLSNQVQQLEGEITKPLFDVLKKGATDLSVIISSPSFQQSFGVLTSQIESVAAMAVRFGTVLLPLLPTIIELGKDVVALTVALGVGALITALGNAVTAAGGLAAALTTVGTRISTVLTAIGPAGAIIGAATLAWIALDHAFDEYVARARELLTLVGQFSTVLTSLQSQIDQADTPEKRVAGMIALHRELTSLIETQEALKLAGKDPAQIEALSNQINQVRALIADYDSLAGKKARLTKTEELAGKYSGAARETSDEDDKQYEAGLDHIQQLAKVQGEFDAKRVAAAKAFGLDSTASYEQIKRAAASLREQQQSSADNKPAVVDLLPLELEVDKYKQQFARIQTVVKQAQELAEHASVGKPSGPDYKPSQVDPNYDLNVKTAEELTTKLADAQKALALAQTANSQASRDNGSSLRESNAEAYKRLQVYGELQKLHAKLDDTSKSAQNLTIQREQAAVEERLSRAKLAAGANNVTPEVRDLEVKTRELRLQRQYLQENGRLDEDHIKLAHDIAVAEVDGTLAKKEGVQAAREERQEELATDRDRKTALLDLRDRIQEIQKNPLLTNEQKQQGMKPLLLQELALLKENIRERDELIKRYSSDPKRAGEVANLQRENVQDRHEETDAGNQLKGMTFGGQVEGELTKLKNEFTVSGQTIGQSLSNGITTGINSVSSALTNLITQTGSWKDAFQSAGRAIVGELVNMGVKFISHYAMIGAEMLAHAALRTVLRQQDTAETIASNTSKSASSATAGLLESITSYGVAAVVGAAAFAAAMALAGGFAEGGLIPGRSSSKDNRIANVATGEFITRASSVDHYGPAIFHALNERRIPRAVVAGPSFMQALGGMQVRRTGFATGGLVGGADGYSPIIAGGSPNVDVRGHQVTLVQVRDRNELLQALQSSEGRKIVLGHVTANRTKVGISS